MANHAKRVPIIKYTRTHGLNETISTKLCLFKVIKLIIPVEYGILVLSDVSQYIKSVLPSFLACSVRFLVDCTCKSTFRSSDLYSVTEHQTLSLLQTLSRLFF